MKKMLEVRIRIAFTWIDHLEVVKTGSTPSW